MDKAKFINGEFRCPKCSSLFLRVRFGGEVRGGQIWCRRCKKEFLLETPKDK